MKYHKINIYYIVLLILVSTIQCKKITPDNSTRSEHFLQVFNASGNQNLRTIRPTEDNGFLIVGTENYNGAVEDQGLVILKTDFAGNVKWRTNTLDSLLYPFVTYLNDGGILLSSYVAPGKLCKLDKDGKIIFNGKIPSGTYDCFSFPLLANDGNFLIASTNGQSQGGPSTNWVDKISATGKHLGSRKFSDSSFFGKILYLNLYKFEDTATYYFYGLKFDTTAFAWSWKDNPKMFIGKQSYSGNQLIYNNIKTIDKKNETNFNINQGIAFSNQIHLLTPDKGIVILNIQVEPNNAYLGYMVKLDEHFNILWERELRIGINGTSPYNITLNNDGNYLISGACKMSDKIPNQPFACTISPDGKLLWSKIFTTALSGTFYSGTQMKDGSLLFGGTSNGFGNGSSLNDLFMIKADKEGNVE